MTGAEHYAEAERLLDEFGQSKKPMGWSITPIVLTRALIHALLAAAAASARGGYR